MNKADHHRAAFPARFIGCITRIVLPGHHRILIAGAILLMQWTAGALAQIPPGFELVRITDDEDFDDLASINDCGQVVYSKRINQDWDLEEIFLYDNGRTTQLTHNTIHDWLPDINNASTIIWTHRIESFDARVWMLRDGVTTERFSGRSGEINDGGHIVFKRYGEDSCRGPEMDIFLYDGETITQITHTEGDANQSQSINNSDDIAWVRYDFCPSTWESDIMARINGETIQITADRFQPRPARINDTGIIAWSTLVRDGECDHLIEFLVNGNIERLPGCARHPHINDHGDMAFIRRLPEENISAVYYSADQSEYLLTYEGAVTTGVQDINNWGEIPLWINLGLPNSDYTLLRRIRTGDSEFDGDIDIDDLAKLVDCMTGPMWVERANPGPEDSLCECRFLDINHDGSVDLRDYAIFQQNFAKP